MRTKGLATRASPTEAHRRVPPGSAPSRQCALLHGTAVSGERPCATTQRSLGTFSLRPRLRGPMSAFCLRPRSPSHGAAGPRGGQVSLSEVRGQAAQAADVSYSESPVAVFQTAWGLLVESK
jgi:hypothetical protein